MALHTYATPHFVLVLDKAEAAPWPSEHTVRHKQLPCQPDPRVWPVVQLFLSLYYKMRLINTRLSGTNNTHARPYIHAAGFLPPSCPYVHPIGVGVAKKNNRATPLPALPGPRPVVYVSPGRHASLAGGMGKGKARL